MRYAAHRPATAARERFPTRQLTDADGDLWLVHLAGMPPALHLTHQANLDTLHLDDRISTGRIDPAVRVDPDPLLERCGELADAVYDWWGHQPPPIVYRSRTTPTGRNVAFTATASPEPLAAGRLRDAAALHVHLVLRLGFTVPAGWLTRS